MKSLAGLAVFLCVSSVPGSALAEPYTIAANGDLFFNSTFTTQGVFSCGALTPCSGAGTNTVTFGSGTSQVTITFTGVSTTVAVGSTNTPVSLGTFSVAGPSGGLFPESVNVNVGIVGFRLSMTQSSPVESTDSLFQTFGPGGGEELRLLTGGSFLAFPAGPNPPGFAYTALVYTLDPFPFAIRGLGTTDLQASAGAIPEPGSLLLVGSALAFATRGWARRRRGQVAVESGVGEIRN